MSKRKPAYLPLGSISTGTLKAEDLLESFLHAAGRLHLNRLERIKVNSIQRLVTSDYKDEWAEGGRDTTDLDYLRAEDVATLTDILSNHCPDMTRFGTAEGDSADFGIWVDWDTIKDAEYEGELTRMNEPNPKCDTPYALVINDHGNSTLYRRAGRRWVQCWAVV